jgi:phage N-6-adenine-methyltransferase
MAALEVVPTETGSVTIFQPEQALKRDSEADAVIAYAKRVRDWTMLEAAIDQKLEDQQAFVEWWRANVRRKGERSNLPDRGHLLVVDAEKLTGIRFRQVSRWKRHLEALEKYRASLLGAVWAKFMAEVNNTTATKWTGDPESYTPSKYIEAARKVMGGIDLDPASNEFAQKTVKADRWYGEEENGLEQSWAGRVFLNPPYSFPEVSRFVEKLCSEFEAGNVTAGVLLTNNNTDAKWWHRAAGASQAVCFTLGRINFYKADGSLSQPTNGQTFFYLGPDADDFRGVFGEHGLVMAIA